MSIRSYVRSTDSNCESRSQNIFPSIDVSINALCATARTIPTTNTQWQFIYYETAMVTPLTARKKSVNLDQFSPVPFTFIFKLTKHFTPSSIRYRPSKLVVFNHVSHCQVFNSNQAIVPNQVRRQFVQKIGTSIFNFGVYSSYFMSRFMSVTRAANLPRIEFEVARGSAFRTFGFPTQFLLRYFKLLIQPIKMLGIGYLFSVTSTNQTCYASVNTNLFLSRWQCLNSVIIYQERDKPSSRRVELDCNSRRLTSFGKASRPNYVQGFRTFGKPDVTVSELKSRFGKFCATTIPLFLKAKIFSPFSPKVSKGFLQMPKALLQRYTANLVEKIQVFDFLPTGQKTRGFLILNPLLSFIPGFGSGSQSLVIDQTHTTHCSSQEIFLLVSWVKAILVGTFGHASHYTILDVNTIVRGWHSSPD